MISDNKLKLARVYSPDRKSNFQDTNSYEGANSPIDKPRFGYIKKLDLNKIEDLN